MKKISNRPILRLLALCALLLLAGCHTMRSTQDGPPDYDVDVSKIPNAIPKCEPRSKYGNPESYVVLGKRYHVLFSNKNYVERGFASWYGTKFHAKRTSSGEPYSMLTMTAAHKTLPLPTYVQVANLRNGKYVIVKVNDRGPFHENRIIDLSYVAAKKLGIVGHGTGLVEVRSIVPGEPPTLAAVTPVITENGNPKIYLQMGAFAIRENAEKLSARIKEITSNPIHIQESVLNAQPIYKVQIGPLASTNSTDELHHQLQTSGFGDAVTVIQ